MNPASLLLQECDSKTCDIYYHLETLCICYPGRLTGSETLERALEYLRELGEVKLSLGSAREQTVTCPQWVRGDAEKEKLYVKIEALGNVWPLPHPDTRVMPVLANGCSVGTPEDKPAKGEIAIIHNTEMLHEEGKAGNLEGKIVLVDWQTFVTYGALSGAYRNDAASQAASYGAIGIVIRSIAPNGSIGGLHTGTMEYHESVTKIPACCLSAENTELLTRLHERGYQLNATLCLPCKELPPRESKNIIFDLPGCHDDPDVANSIVLIGAHSDSWECHHQACQGAHDDGQGIAVIMQVLHIIKKHYPDGCMRTIRVVLFVDEEVRQSGASAYFESLSESELAKHYIVMETDLGAGPVCGFGFSSLNCDDKGEKARDIVKSILKPMNDLIHEKEVVNRIEKDWAGWGVDTYPLCKAGIPGLLLRHEDTWWNGDYFHHHHTASDTIDHVDKSLLILNLKCMLAATFLCANSLEVIPRGNLTTTRKRKL